MIRYFFSSVMAAALIPTQVSAATCGYASYYGVGDGFHGNMTANGEQFNAYGRTVAHRWLPFGTKIKVTNQRNGASVVVRVNDRGPYHGGRVLDLSYGAFNQIAPPSQGEAKICYSVI
jgi:rare lipoprotein A